MSRSKSWIAVLPSLVIPVCIGMMLYLGMLALIQHDVITNELVLRYLTGHSVSKITVAMFFIGLASLAAIAINVYEQFGAVSKTGLTELTDDSAEPTTAKVSDSKLAERLCLQIGEFPKWYHGHYLWNRMNNALESIKRTGSAVHVEDELKYLADVDLDQQQQRYSLVQILIWATPMLGFLGTVLGISQALGGISVGPENDFQGMMNGLRGSLYIAFDTTALALTLSMILMFGQFFVDRFETQLLLLVDHRVRKEIAGQFDLSAAPVSADSNKDVSGEVISAIGTAVEHQTDVWRKTVQAAESAWTASLSDVSGQVQSSLTAALDESVQGLAHSLGESIGKADDSMARRWEQWQVTLSQNARSIDSQQKHLAEQTGLVREWLGEVKRVDSLPVPEPDSGSAEISNETPAKLSEVIFPISGLAQPQFETARSEVVLSFPKKAA